MIMLLKYLIFIEYSFLEWCVKLIKKKIELYLKKIVLYFK